MPNLTINDLAKKMKGIDIATLCRRRKRWAEEAVAREALPAPATAVAASP